MAHRFLEILLYSRGPSALICIVSIYFLYSTCVYTSEGCEGWIVKNNNKKNTVRRTELDLTKRRTRPSRARPVLNQSRVYFNLKWTGLG